MTQRQALRRQRRGIFISYSRKDFRLASASPPRSPTRPFEPFIDKTDIAPGEPWQERLAGLIAPAIPWFSWSVPIRRLAIAAGSRGKRAPRKRICRLSRAPPHPKPRHRSWPSSLDLRRRI